MYKIKKSLSIRKMSLIFLPEVKLKKYAKHNFCIFYENNEKNIVSCSLVYFPRTSDRT